MRKARLIGPLMMIICGAALVFGAPSGAIDAGVQNPCYAPPPSLEKAVLPPSGCCGPNIIILEKTGCTPITTPSTTPTTAPPVTTVPLTTVPRTIPSTTAQVTTTTMAPTTTQAPAIRPATAVAPTKALARTGSNPAPMTAIGATLMVLGAGLLVAGRRRAAL